VSESNDKLLFGFLNTNNKSIDMSPEAVELRNMGVNNVDLRSCLPQYRIGIVTAVKEMFNAHPELRGQLNTIKCDNLDRVCVKTGRLLSPYATYGPVNKGVPFGGVLKINSKHYGSRMFPSKLKKNSEDGLFVPNTTPQSIIYHELGHGLHLEICSLNTGVKNGSIPDNASYDELVINQYMGDAHAEEIVEQACADLGIEFESRDFSENLSKYGRSDYGEALAEAIAEVFNSKNPRPLAQAIYNRLLQYLKRMRGEI